MVRTLQDEGVTFPDTAADLVYPVVLFAEVAS